MKTLSDHDRYYYAPAIKFILDKLKDGEPHYTHSLYGIGSLRSTKDDGATMRKILKTLEHDGLIEKIDLGCNIHKWKIKPTT